MIWEVATSNWLDAGLWQGLDGINLIEYPEEGGKDVWTCFEDLYLVPRYGVYYSPPPDYDKWYETLWKVVGGPFSQEDTVEERCRGNRLRIHVLQRDPRSRAFTNLENVTALAEEYTSLKVPVASVSASMSVREQARVFSDFDVLITPHGSQLVNLLFTMRRAAVIEINIVMRDMSWQKNYAPLHAYYGFSTNHQPSGTPDLRARMLCK